MKPLKTLLAAALGVASIMAQDTSLHGAVRTRDVEGRPVFSHFGFLPGEASPVRMDWVDAGMELHATAPATGAGDRRPALVGGMFSIGSTIEVQELAADACLFIGHRTPTAGPPLQLAYLRRVDGAWRMEAYAIMEKVQQSIDAAGLPEHFSGAKLVAWDGATRTATMAVRLGRYVRGERAGDEPAGSAVLECQVPLIALDVRSPFGAEPPKSKLIAGGDELRTHRSGATCVLSTVLAETNPKDVRQGFRLRAWLRDETGEWRNLRLPATWVERNYAMARATDGALVVAELVTTGSERVLRSTRWTMGQTELAPVVTEKALAQPPAKDAIIVWQTTSHGPVAWSIENGRATLVR